MKQLLAALLLFSMSCGDMGTRGGNPAIPLRISFVSNPRAPIPQRLEVSFCFQSIGYIPDQIPERYFAALWPNGELFKVANNTSTSLFSGSFDLLPGTFDAIGFQFSNLCEHAAKVVNRHGTFTLMKLEGSLVFNFYDNPVTVGEDALSLEFEISEILTALADARSEDKVKEILILPGGYSQTR